MSRPRLVALTAVAVAALTAGGVAAATHRAQTTQQASASFNAGTVSRSHGSSCTASDGTYTDTTATYTGTATSGDARLSGALQILAHSVLNTSTGLGWVEGTFRIRGTNAGSHGTFHAAISGGNAVGALVGDANGPQSKVIASLSAAFSPSAGFSSGSLGSGSATGTGILFNRGACTHSKPPKPVKTTFVSKLHFASSAGVLSSKADGSFTVDVTRDSSGTITGGKAVFYVNYRFGGPVTINDLALHQGAKGQTGPNVLDAGTGTIVDTDGSGNLTYSVTAPADLLQKLLSSPRGYYIELDTSNGNMRAQLGDFDRR